MMKINDGKNWHYFEQLQKRISNGFDWLINKSQSLLLKDHKVVLISTNILDHGMKIKIQTFLGP